MSEPLQSAAAHARWAQASEADRAEQGRRGQAGLRAKFEREIREASPEASDAEVAKRTQNAYQAHIQMMVYRSAKARRDKSNKAARAEIAAELDGEAAS